MGTTTTLTRASWTRPVRDEKRQDLTILLQHLCIYVQTTADANPAQAASIIESSGMSVKKVRVSPARVFAAMRWRVSGSVKLVAPKAAGKSVAYEWAYSIDGMKTWVLLPVTVQASTIVDGLQPGSTVVFRYRVTTKRGAGDWSDPVSIIVD
jgi:hypothetical protein